MSSSSNGFSGSEPGGLRSWVLLNKDPDAIFSPVSVRDAIKHLCHMSGSFRKALAVGDKDCDISAIASNAYGSEIGAELRWLQSAVCKLEMRSELYPSAITPGKFDQLTQFGSGVCLLNPFCGCSEDQEDGGTEEVEVEEVEFGVLLTCRHVFQFESNLSREQPKVCQLRVTWFVFPEPITSTCPNYNYCETMTLNGVSILFVENFDPTEHLRNPTAVLFRDHDCALVFVLKRLFPHNGRIGMIVPSLVDGRENPKTCAVICSFPDRFFTDKDLLQEMDLRDPSLLDVCMTTSVPEDTIVDLHDEFERRVDRLSHNIRNLDFPIGPEDSNYSVLKKITTILIVRRQMKITSASLFREKVVRPDFLKAHNVLEKIKETQSDRVEDCRKYRRYLRQFLRWRREFRSRVAALASDHFMRSLKHPGCPVFSVGKQRWLRSGTSTRFGVDALAMHGSSGAPILELALVDGQLEPRVRSLVCLFEKSVGSAMEPPGTEERSRNCHFPEYIATDRFLSFYHEHVFQSVCFVVATFEDAKSGSLQAEILRSLKVSVENMKNYARIEEEHRLRTSKKSVIKFGCPDFDLELAPRPPPKRAEIEEEEEGEEVERSEPLSRLEIEERLLAAQAELKAKSSELKAMVEQSSRADDETEKGGGGEDEEEG